MSRLGDAIRRSQRVEAAPIGFAAARPAQRPTMLVAASVNENGVAGAISAGADVIVLQASSLSADSVKKARDAARECVLGAQVPVANAAEAKSLREAGLDFLIVEAEMTPAAALLDDDLGYVLALPENPEETFLRSLDALNLEALYLAGIPSPLTVAGQIELGRVVALGRKPLLVKTPDGTSTEDLQCLRAAGAVCLLSEAAAVAGLKEAVTALPPRRQKREERTVVSLPRGQVPSQEEDDDDDD